MKKPLASIAACAALTLALSACQRAETPSEMAGDVAQAEQARQESVLDAQMDEAQVRAETAEDRAEARYNTEIARVSGDLEVAKERCDALAGDAQRACNQSAEAAHDSARANAMAELEAERARQAEALAN